MLTDWNHQKIPYFSVPPAIHPSQIPSTIPGTANGAAVAPGAETVGQAQILTEFSKPFELAGLFGAADAGAFASEDARSEIVMDDDTTSHEVTMVTDDAPVGLPVKRSHSPGLERELGRGLQQRPAPDASFARTPKRLRRAKDLSAYEEAAAKNHPLSRKTLKRDAKRARRAATRMRRQEARDGSMEVDTLENTFMAGIEH